MIESRAHPTFPPVADLFFCSLSSPPLIFPLSQEVINGSPSQLLLLLLLPTGASLRSRVCRPPKIPTGPRVLHKRRAIGMETSLVFQSPRRRQNIHLPSIYISFLLLLLFLYYESSIAHAARTSFSDVVWQVRTSKEWREGRQRMKECERIKTGRMREREREREGTLVGGQGEDEADIIKEQLERRLYDERKKET